MAPEFWAKTRPAVMREGLISDRREAGVLRQMTLMLQWGMKSPYLESKHVPSPLAVSG